MSGHTKFCKNCKKEVAASNYTMHVVHCNRNICLCSECGQPVPRSQYQQHVQSLHATLDCGKCGSKIDAVRFYAHEREECPRRLVACQYCDLEVVASEHQKHTDYCGARTERCKGCTKYVQVRHLQFHYSSDHKYLTPEDKESNNGTESGDESNEECPVCLGTITLPLALECGHVFCMVCVKGIANTTKNCAICRRDIARDMLMDIRFCREEDVIKNYVNKPRDPKKTFRSRSVPGRVQSAPTATRRAATTQDYDDMVSHLLSSRTSSTPYRYQRPSNTHTPASYTPYSYINNTSTNNTNTNTTSSSTNDDDCCCSASSQSSAANPSSATTNVTSSQVSSTPVPKTQSNQSSTKASTAPTDSTISPQDSVRTPTQSTNSSSGSDSRRKRPTSLALSSSLNDSNASEATNLQDRLAPPPNATQEQYDRWLAFRLANAEDDVSAAEFNKKHRPIKGRSNSMPEGAIVAVTHRVAAAEASSDSSDTSEEEEGEDNNNTGGAPKRRMSNRPPASPRTTACQSGGSATGSLSYASSSSLSASSRSPSLSKSSSDSNANGGASSSASSTSRAINTGTRPKSSTGLKKRVSFKEDAPEERRMAPIMLPCEFCDEMFPERDLMRHQTSCDLNETQMPRARRDSITSPPLLNSPTRNLNSPSSSRFITSSSSTPSSNLGSPVSPTSRRKIPPNLPLGSSSKRADHSKSSNAENHRTPPTSPPPRPPHAPHTNHHTFSNNNSNGHRIRSSPQPNTNELTDSSSDSRPTSVSPCPPHSHSSYSSGISSMASSTRSVSSTPTSSSSASPTHAVVDTPTDIEADFEDDDTPYIRPRRGKLLSSAICSWRHMSGSSRDRPKYTRSNTAPLEDTGEESPEPNPVINSHSASQLPPLPPRPESTPVESDQSSPDCIVSSTEPHQQKTKSPQVFIKRHKKYRAPPPPTQTSKHPTTQTHTSNETQFINQQNTNKQDLQTESYIRFDSKPMMNGETNNDSERCTPCDFCQQFISLENLQNHKSLCEMAPHNQAMTFRVATYERAPSPQDGTSSSMESQQINSHTNETSVHSSHHFRRYERAQSVLDDRCLEVNRGSRLQRANSIKEGTRSRPTELTSMGRRWSSREQLFCPRGESPSPFSTSSTYTGSSISGGKYSSRGWTDHISMVQDDVKAKLNSAKTLLYDREKKAANPEGDFSKPNFVNELRSWLDNTSSSAILPTMGSSRYRSSSVARPSLYSSSAYGSTTRLSSLDYRSPYDGSSSRSPFGGISDSSFGSAFRRRYVR